MRATPGTFDSLRVLHLDLDAFFAAVEQRDKPSLRGKPVIVGGLGPRGVVSTASYEARAFGVHSAMRMAEARARCPHAAFLSGRFGAYRVTSRAVMDALHALSPRVEPVSLDEAYVDLTASQQGPLTAAEVRRLGTDLKARIRQVSGGVTASVGAGTSKLVAKIASDLEKPDGLVVVDPGTEIALLHPMPVTRVPGIGPATTQRLRRIGVRTIGDLDRAGEAELVALVGQAHGHGLARLARAEDDRPVESERESKSISVEDTFDQDVADPVALGVIVERLANRVTERLAHDRLSGRTVTVKIRLFDFTTHTRSATLPGPTDDARTIVRMARRLLADVDTSAGARLLGVGVSGLADWVQTDLLELLDLPEPSPGPEGTPGTAERPAPADSSGDTGTAAGAPEGTLRPRWSPGADVEHVSYGRGWVWGAGLGRVTVRFETADTGPGPVRTLPADDPELVPWEPPETD